MASVQNTGDSLKMYKISYKYTYGNLSIDVNFSKIHFVFEKDEIQIQEKNGFKSNIEDLL